MLENLESQHSDVSKDCGGSRQCSELLPAYGVSKRAALMGILPQLSTLGDVFGPWS